ncbi:MAG: U32 family peptidase [Treponema sp.]|nr:U32 family peptidase [Treponema sp.]
MKPLELLAPAGSPEALDAAIAEGADAVYLGLKNFNARMRSANFAYSQFEGALRALHSMGRRIYVTVNTVFEQREADRMYQLLQYLAALGPDGLIVQDFGVAAMVRDCFPSLKLHASTQMNIASARGANALSKFGFSRVVLARELSFEELKDCRAGTNMELEVFVHGALCVSASGLCLFSSYLGGKSANRGLCTQACRRYYQQEDGGGYYFSPHDLQLIERIPGLAAAGINAFKIEGRMKSAEYVGTVVSAYRLVLDALAENAGESQLLKTMDKARAILHNDFARPKTEFYFDRSSPAAGRTGAGRMTADSAAPSWLNPSQDGGTGIPLGALVKVRGSGARRQGLIPGGDFVPMPGDTVRIHAADDRDRRSHKISAVEKDDSADSGAGVWISIPEGFEPGDTVYLIQTQLMSRRYDRIVSPGIHRRTPGRDKAPEKGIFMSQDRSAAGGEGLMFPQGFYAVVSRIEDLFILQSSRPIRVILTLTRRNVEKLLGKEPLPFNTGEIILTLDPYFPQADELELGNMVEALLNQGYRQFIVNNPGHFSYFRGATGSPVRADATPGGRAGKTRRLGLIAGPYLYTFNRWAVSLVSAMGTDYFVCPLENNRQNLERTVDPPNRSRVFVTIFTWPALFRIRENLERSCHFTRFFDSRGEEFHLAAGEAGSRVYPERPFSIVDKVPFLREAGFSRFILDLSGSPCGKSGPSIKKNHYRDLMKSAQNAIPLPDISRFNWKDGFYQEDQDKLPVRGLSSPGAG